MPVASGTTLRICKVAKVTLDDATIEPDLVIYF